MRSPEELRHNLSRVILHVRSGHATSRRVLSGALGLSPSTTGYYVDQLIASGHLAESGLVQGRMGRPKRMLRTLPGVGWFAGIEFNAERAQAVRVDFSGAQTRKLTHRLPENADTASVLQEIAALITELHEGRKGALLGIGIGAPGLIDPAAGVGVHYAFLPGWRNVPVRAELAKHFEVPIILKNNLRVIALAERWFGGGRELDDYVILGPRRGFGIAVVKHGRLIDGPHHATGEIGRWVWPLNGEVGEMQQALCSAAVWRRLAGVTSTAPLPGDLRTAMQSLAQVDGEAWQSVVNDYARVMGLLHLLLDARAYFLHGPLTALGPRFGADIALQAVKLMPALKDMPPNIVVSSLGDDAGALGAASHAMEAWQPRS
ncbi:MAG: ROK family protein [Prosthecobacter sp.]|nr:ROK family protein [Prosthecobacter sp.]